MGLWRLYQRFVNKRYREEIKEYTNNLKEVADDNVLATVIAEAILFRVDLENEGTLPLTRLDDGSICPELIGLAPLWINLRKCLNMLEKANKGASHMILSLWYYTVLSLIKPDLLNDGKDMWNELKRGLKNADSELKRIIAKRYSDNPSPRMRAFDILKVLPPKQLR